MTVEIQTSIGSPVSDYIKQIFCDKINSCEWSFGSSRLGIRKVFGNETVNSVIWDINQFLGAGTCLENQSRICTPSQQTTPGWDKRVSNVSLT